MNVLGLSAFYHDNSAVQASVWCRWRETVAALRRRSGPVGGSTIRGFRAMPSEHRLAVKGLGTRRDPDFIAFLRQASLIKFERLLE